MAFSGWGDPSVLLGVTPEKPFHKSIEPAVTPVVAAGFSFSAAPPVRRKRRRLEGHRSACHRHYGLDPRQPRPDDAQWTGAEIKSCCRLAALLDVPLVQAGQNVVPVAVTAGDKIESLRQWASGRCLSADRAGVYSRADVGEWWSRAEDSAGAGGELIRR
jgi:hypothetical protein